MTLLPAQQMDQHWNQLLSKYYMDGLSETESGRIENELLVAMRPRLMGWLKRESSLSAMDVDDLCQEALKSLLNAIRSSRKGSTLHIKNLYPYAYTTARREIIKLTRSRYPESTLLTRLHYLASESYRPRTFARWERVRQMLFGLRERLGQDCVKSRNYNRFCADNDCCRSDWLVTDSVSLPLLLKSLFDWIDTPAIEKELAHHLLKILPAELGDVEMIEDILLKSEKDIGQLPLQHWDRRPDVIDWQFVLDWLAQQTSTTNSVLLLNKERDDLAHLFGCPAPIIYVATMLNITVEEMRSLWRHLPLTDEQIAKHLNSTTNYVQRLRSTRLKKLRESRIGL